MKFNPFIWVLVAFPLYLLINGRLPEYLRLATATRKPEGENGDEVTE